MLVYNLLPRILVGMLLYIKLAYTSELGAQRSAGEGSSINAGGANRSFNQDAGSGARNQQFAVALLSKLLAYTSTGSNSDVGEVALNDIGFTDSAARVRVKDLYGVLDIALSEKYKYRFTPAAASAKENNMLSIPFSDVFTLTNESIKYISRVLEMLSTASRAQARNLAPLFGIDATGLSSPAAIHSVARLLGAISTMHPESLSQVAEAGSMEHDDPAAINKSLFTLGDLLNINSQRVSGVSGLFKSISKLSPGNLLGYLYDVGWERDITSAAQTGRREAKGIPSFNYMFPLSDQVLSDMALAAQRYEDGDKTEAVQLRPLVQDYLKQADSLWSLIPGLSSVSSLVDVGSSPLISAITQLIALSYKYPNASYQDLLLLYYQSIGMPGLSQLTEYPSQYIGGLASSIVGGYVSGAISTLVSNVLGPVKTPAATGTHTAPKSATSTSLTSPTQSHTTSTSTSASSTPNIMPTTPTSSPTGTVTASSSSSPSSSATTSAHFFWPWELALATTRSAPTLPTQSSSAASKRGGVGAGYIPGIDNDVSI